MPSCIPDVKRRTIEVDLSLKKDTKEVAKAVHVSYRSIQRFRKNLVDYGSLVAPKAIAQGRPRTITLEMEESLLNYLAARPSMYIDEQVYYLWDTFEVQVSEKSIMRMLKLVKWSKKKMQVRAAQQNPELRAQWMSKLSSWTADQLIFIDESATNERTADRKYGWAPIGLTPREAHAFRRSKRWSLCPAYTIDGYVAWEIVHGSFTAVLFEDFIKNKVLPLCNPFPLPRSVIIMDNAPIHRTEALEKLCHEAGVVLEFLPPYSPDFNPIEESFAEMKAWMRKNYTLQDNYEHFEGFLELAVQYMATKAGNHFRSCHIDIP